MRPEICISAVGKFVMFRILQALDRHRFLGFPIWEFSLRSLRRLYGWLFLRDIVLRHPIRTLQGLLAYRLFSWEGCWQQPILHVGEGSRVDLGGANRAEEGTSLVVALGFCQKPLGAPGTGCPAGRFNHECHALARADLLEVRPGQLPGPCRDCDIRAIGTVALRAGAAVYIMTSAVDIARHLFVPVLGAARFRHGLFLLCPYSVPAMVLPLLICNVRSVLVGYSQGDCRDYAQFILADEGTKDVQTRLATEACSAVFELLQEADLGYQATGWRPSRFRREGVLYVPSA